MRTLRLAGDVLVVVLVVSAANMLVLAVLPTPPVADLIICVAVTVVLGDLLGSRIRRRRAS
jgi:hypothetical protein